MIISISSGISKPELAVGVVVGLEADGAGGESADVLVCMRGA